MALDGLHMRHYQYMSDQALDFLACLLQVVEIAAMLPRQLRASFCFDPEKSVCVPTRLDLF